MKISASFLSINDNLEENILKLDKTDIDYLHIDIMDGKFVQNKTYTFDQIKELLKYTNKPKDVHLMVSDVLSYIDDYSKINPEFITFHYEAVSNHFEIINYIKSKGIKVGISIKPTTEINYLIPYLDIIDLILVMSVEPGMGGQQFIESTTNKINHLKYLKEADNYNYVIEVDGGINDQTINKINKADIAVIGSFITNSYDYQTQIDKIRLEHKKI